MLINSNNSNLQKLQGHSGSSSSASIAPTLHNLLISPPGTSSETTATGLSSSVDSPGQEIRLGSLDDEIMLMEAD